MSAQGAQPQGGSGAGEYDDWAISSQYGPEDWEFDQEARYSEYGDDFTEDQDDCFYGEELCLEDFDDRAFATNSGHTYGSQLRQGEKFNAKTAPSFDGSMSWFMFCEVVKDWQEITVITPDKQGPHLRNNLKGVAALYKRAFDRDTLAKEDGVAYFLRVLKKEFIRDAPRSLSYGWFRMQRTPSHDVFGLALLRL